jgi:excisionase family DNA binding protein
MAQKFTSLEEAAQQLGISKERLTQLREANKVRAYRDGASWKFRSEDIDKLASDGIPQLDGPPSDIGLDEGELGLAPDSDVKSEPAAPSPAASGLDLELADEEPAEAPMASDIGLEDVDEPTVAGIDEGGSSDAISLDSESEIDVYSDSILLSEAELGESTGRPPSTIIGKAELDLDADLDLSPAPGMSDVKLAPASDIIISEDVGLDLTSPSGNFEGLPEVDIDLEAESSRILSPEDVAKVKGGAAAAQAASAESDLQLAPSDSTAGAAESGVDLGGSIASGTGLTGLSALELDEDDDQVLGEGSDVTLSGESSGINIISPSDSGLALDEVKLDLTGSSPIGSSLDLGGSGIEDVALEPMDLGGSAVEPIGEDFQLTPLGEEGAEEEERDSSQVIALEEISEETAGSPLGTGIGLGEPGMGEDFAAVGLGAAAVPVGVVSAQETPFSVANVLGLASCLLLLGLSGMMVFDLIRNIWSWDDVTTLNSSLLESVLNPFL